MRKLWDFHGGIHPPQHKERSTATPIRPATLPARLVVPLQQHIGTPARALVAPGELVHKGQMLAAPRGDLSVPVHAPTSGRVLAIEPHPVAHPSGLEDWCLLLEPDGDDLWHDLEPCRDFRSEAPQALLERIRTAGIAGLGGAGFPTGDKLLPGLDSRLHTLIINGAECEPYITADQMLMRERATELVTGIEILAHILQPGAVLLAVEDNKPDAIAALRDATSGTAIELVVIPTKYPSGGEKQLIEILTGQQLPHDRLPPDIGIVCQNVGTAYAIYRAIVHGQPLISRIVTVTGEAVTRPGNYEVLIGTPLEDLLRQAGVAETRVHRLVLGGPMMGFALESATVPVSKTSNCIIAATAQEFPPAPPAQACIRCGQCEQVCPMELLPQQLFWYARSGEHDKAQDLNLFDCIECGACSYVCPSTIPLVQYYRSAKGEIRQQQADTLKADRARQRFEARQQRMEREEAEKEARRKARKAAVAARQGKTRSAQPQDRAAAVQAALARTQARRGGAGVDTAALEKNLSRTRDKLAQMEAALAQARQSDPERVAKLEQAVASSRARMEAAEHTLAQARQKTGEAHSS